MTRTELSNKLGELYRRLSPFEKSVICQKYKDKYEKILDENFMKFLKVFLADGIDGLKKYLSKTEKDIELKSEDIEKYIGK